MTETIDTGQGLGSTPPNDAVAEAALIGAVLISQRALDETVGHIQAEDFYQPRHEQIWRAVIDMGASGIPVDAVTLADRLRASGELAAIGGPAYLHTLASSVPVAANVGHYASILRDRSLLRALGRANIATAAMLHRGISGVDAVAEAQERLMGLTIPDDNHGRMIGPIVSEVLDAAADGRQALETRDWGYGPDMPPMVCGRTTILAARPGQGKSTAAIDAARYTAVELGLPVAMFTLEMSQAEVGAKVVAAESKIVLPRVQKGEMNAEDWGKWAARNDAVLNAPLYVNDFTATNPAYIRATCLRLQRELGPLGLVIVDHLGLMEANGAPASKSRQQIVSEFSRQLVILAKDLKTAPILLACQLNRESEKREKKKPQKSDLRESGTLEQDAYQVVLIHRDEEENPENPHAGEAEFIIDKNRGGPKKTVTLAAQLHYSRFMNPATR